MSGDFAAKLFRHKAIFDFHLNKCGTIIEDKAGFFIIENEVITFKSIKSN